MTTGRHLTIGQMAELNNVTKKTLLTYEKHRLIAPACVDDQTGYRYYALEQCATIDMIQQLQQVGFSLAEIAAITRDGDVRALRDALREKSALLHEEIASLSLSRSMAQRLMRTCELCERKPPCGVPTLEWAEERRILYFSVEPYRLDERHADDPPELNQWELSLRQVKSAFVHDGLPNQLFCNAGAFIAREALIRDDLTVSGAYVFDPIGLDSPRSRVFSAGYYLTMVTDGIFAPDGTHTEKDYLERLLEIARAEGYLLLGGYHSEIIAETPLFQFYGRDMMLRLCVPVYVENPASSPYMAQSSNAPRVKPM